MVVINARTSSFSDVPPGAKSLWRAMKGRPATPLVFVLSPDGSNGIAGYHARQIYGNSRKLVRQVKEKIEMEGLGGSNSSSSSTSSSATASTASSPDTSLLFEEQEWTNLDGKVMRAAVQSANASTVIFLLPNKKTIAYPLDQLSHESRQRITGS